MFSSVYTFIWSIFQQILISAVVFVKAVQATRMVLGFNLFGIKSKDERLPIDNRNAEKQGKPASKKASNESDHLVTNKPRALQPQAIDKSGSTHLMTKDQHALGSSLPNAKPSSSTDKSVFLNTDLSAKEDDLIDLSDLNFGPKDAKVLADVLSSAQSTSTPNKLPANEEQTIPEVTKFKRLFGESEPGFNNFKAKTDEFKNNGISSDQKANQTIALKLPPPTTKTTSADILRELDNINKITSPKSPALSRITYTEAPRTTAPILEMVFDDNYRRLIATNPMSCIESISTVNNEQTRKQELSKPTVSTSNPSSFKDTSASSKINPSPEKNNSFNITLGKWLQQEKLYYNNHEYDSSTCPSSILKTSWHQQNAKSIEATKTTNESTVDGKSKEALDDSFIGFMEDRIKTLDRQKQMFNSIQPIDEDTSSKSQKDTSSSDYLTSIKGSSTQSKTPASALPKPVDKSLSTQCKTSASALPKSSSNTEENPTKKPESKTTNEDAVFIEMEEDLANGWTVVENKENTEEKETVSKNNSPNTPSTSSSFENLSPPAEKPKSILKLSSDSTTPNAERLTSKKVDFTPKVKVSGIFVDEPTNHPPVHFECEPLKSESSRKYDKEKKPVSSVEEEWVKRMKTLKRCIDTLKSPNATDVQLSGAMNALEKFYERWSGLQMAPVKSKEDQDKECEEKKQQVQKMKDMEEQIAELTIKNTKLVDEKMKLQDEYNVQVAICQSYKDQEVKLKQAKEQMKNMKEKTTQINNLSAQVRDLTLKVKQLADDKEKLLENEKLLEQQQERERNKAKLEKEKLLEQQRERERNKAKLEEEWLKAKAGRDLYKKDKQQENKAEQSKPDNAQVQSQPPPTEQTKEQQTKTLKAGQTNTNMPERSVQTRSMTKKANSTNQRSNQKTVNPVNNTNAENRTSVKPKYDTSMQPTQVLTNKQNLEQKPSKQAGNEKKSSQAIQELLEKYGGEENVKTAYLEWKAKKLASRVQTEISARSINNQSPFQSPATHSPKPSYAEMAKRSAAKEKPPSVFIDNTNDSDYPSLKKNV